MSDIKVHIHLGLTNSVQNMKFCSFVLSSTLLLRNVEVFLKFIKNGGWVQFWRVKFKRFVILSIIDYIQIFFPNSMLVTEVHISSIDMTQYNLNLKFLHTQLV